MELKLSITGIRESERVVSIIQLGLITALEEKVISIEEAEEYLFNIYSIEKLANLGFNKKVLGILEEGCELEDIKSLVPEKLPINLERIKSQIIKNLSSNKSSNLNKERIIK